MPLLMQSRLYDLEVRQADDVLRGSLETVRPRAVRKPDVSGGGHSEKPEKPTVGHQNDEPVPDNLSSPQYDASISAEHSNGLELWAEG
jgi:hypothetical protein